jgi:hypothetical protein
VCRKRRFSLSLETAYSGLLGLLFVASPFINQSANSVEVDLMPQKESAKTQGAPSPMVFPSF